MLVIDASEGFTVEDKKIANRVMDDGRAFTLVANKWDLVEEKDRTYKILEETLQPVRPRDRDAHVGGHRHRACTVSRRSCSTSTRGGPRARPPRR